MDNMGGGTLSLHLLLLSGDPAEDLPQNWHQHDRSEQQKCRMNWRKPIRCWFGLGVRSSFVKLCWIILIFIEHMSIVRFGQSQGGTTNRWILVWTPQHCESLDQEVRQLKREHPEQMHNIISELEAFEWLPSSHQTWLAGKSIYRWIFPFHSPFKEIL